MLACDIQAELQLLAVAQDCPESPSYDVLSEGAGTIATGYDLADFDSIPGVSCPCGLAKRAFGDLADFPATVHVTEILETACLHYHRTLTEVYYVLECTADSRMQLDQELIPVRVGSCILIRPETRHRAIGRMKVLILVLPKFDPTDEWFD